MAAEQFQLGRGQETLPATDVRAIHDVPLDDLLPKNERTRFMEKKVSLYEYEGVNGHEQAVVFPAVSGYEWYEEFKTIAPHDPGFQDVVSDTALILNAPQGRLARRHQGAGGLWDMVMCSLPTKMQALRDDRRYQYFLSNTTYMQNQARYQLNSLVGNAFRVPYDEEKVEQVAYFQALLTGQEVIEKRDLMKVFGVYRADVGAIMKSTIPAMRDRGRRNLKPREVFGRYFHQLSYTDAAQLIAQAANSRFRNKAETLEHLAQLTVEKRYAALELMGILNRFFVGDREYAFPGNNPVMAAHPEDDGSFRVELNIGLPEASTLNAWVRPEQDRLKFVAETFEQQIAEHAEEIKKRRNKIVPVVRISQDPDNPFLVHEIDPMPTDVIDRVVTDMKASEPMAHRSWISGVVGQEMMVLAHPGIRKIADPWSKMWTKDRITISELMGRMRQSFVLPDGTSQYEPDQFNGPVQLSVTAVEASRRYPEYFKPFIDGVQAQFGK